VLLTQLLFNSRTKSITAYPFNLSEVPQTYRWGWVGADSCGAGEAGGEGEDVVDGGVVGDGAAVEVDGVAGEVGGWGEGEGGRRSLDCAWDDNVRTGACCRG